MVDAVCAVHVGEYACRMLGLDLQSEVILTCTSLQHIESWTMNLEQVFETVSSFFY